MAKKILIKLTGTNLELHKEGFRIGETIEVSSIDAQGKAWTGRDGHDVVIYPDDYVRV
ncbi:hypothetical protein [Roseivirga thermotolerans]|uniref:Uncharacterized protein n=1 Tax=Roseivirga thermotolerans TaxID=1758176 RepID=A0ABQ3I8U1_9BACT|nr:hypothetical protein [Roseivirga thermotolerans]GHE65104.1 hypothetical protein GCM10011340_20190 [Roseivirga thermotolerans]